MDLYAENVLEHYRNPLHKARLTSPTVTHDEVNLSCGDSLTVDLLIEGDRITAVGWDGTGCAISQAAMSMLSEVLIGKTLDEINALKKEDIDELLGVPVGPRRLKCELLSLTAVQHALLKHAR